MKYKALFLTTGLLLASFSVKAQEVNKPAENQVRYYIGLQPGLKLDSVNYAPMYRINILPLTLEYSIDRHWDLRVHSIWELAVSTENLPTEFTSVGVELSGLYHFVSKNNQEGPRGFYIAPVLTPSFHYQKLSPYYSLGVGGELGFSFLIGNRWSFTLGAQAGYLLQLDPSIQTLRFYPYASPVIGFGIWL